MISIIVVNYNTTQSTITLIKSIGEYTKSQLELIVVDNGSQPNESETISNSNDDLIIVRSEENLGFSGGNNLGIKIAKGSHLLFLNSDTTLPDRNLPYTLRDSLTKNPKAGMISPLIYFEGSENKLQYAGTTKGKGYTGRFKTSKKLPENKGTIVTDLPHGAAMMVKRTVIDSVGLMPEIYFLYYEEIEWATRIRKKGYSVLLDTSNFVVHAASLTMRKTNTAKAYYLYRNRILFMRRNYKPIILFLLYYSIFVLPKEIFTLISKTNWLDLQLLFKAIRWNLTNSIYKNEPMP
jgi:GT2 family glycosyltransferase